MNPSKFLWKKGIIYAGSHGWYAANMKGIRITEIIKELDEKYIEKEEGFK